MCYVTIDKKSLPKKEIQLILCANNEWLQLFSNALGKYIKSFQSKLASASPSEKKTIEKQLNHLVEQRSTIQRIYIDLHMRFEFAKDMSHPTAENLDWCAWPRKK